MRTHLRLLAVLAAVVAAGSSTGCVQMAEVSWPMEAWEYRVLSPTELAGLEQPPTGREMADADLQKLRESAATDKLNQLGAEGWELIDIENDHFYFKRSLIAE